MTADSTLNVLLIEDNPGDVRLIEEMVRGSEQLLQRFDSGDDLATEATIHHEETLEAGLERLSATDIDVILLDLGLPDSRGLETLAAVTDETAFVPTVVLTGLSDESIGVEAIKRGAQDYLVKDEVTSDLLVRSIHYAIERNRQDRERARRRQQLEALNQLNEIGSDVTHAVITTSTREALEHAVCEQLVGSDVYRFAWIGEVDTVNDRITPRVAAGVEDGYLDELTITLDDGETAEGPSGTAVRTGEVQVMHNVQTDPDYEPWREQAIERGYRSSASIPLEYDDILYGILNIYSPSPSAFSKPEREILSRLGEVIAHAITAIERKEALVSDTVLELEFQLEAFSDQMGGLSVTDGGRLSVDDFVRTTDGVLAYGHARGVPREEFEETLKDAPLVDSLRLLSSGAERYKFELVVTGVDEFVDAVGSHGGRIASATVADGGLRFVVEFPPGRDKRQLIELVNEHCPAAENRVQRLVDRTDDGASQGHSPLDDTLTEKQRTALRTAYSAGLFEWPRESTGQELAERLGISPATFNQHLRGAERQVFADMFSDRDTHDSET